MFTRVVELTTKPGKNTQLAEAINDKVLPILKKQKGFVDETVFVSDKGDNRVLALGFLDKLRTALMNEMNAHDWRVTFSIGAVTFNDPRVTAEEMIAKADELMYSVKLSGKNRVEHSVLDKPNQSDHIVRCSNCRTSFDATSPACPVCGGTALLDLQAAERNAPTQRGVQAYISNLEGELTKALRSLETISSCNRGCSVMWRWKIGFQPIIRCVG